MLDEFNFISVDDRRSNDIYKNIINTFQAHEKKKIKVENNAKLKQVHKDYENQRKNMKNLVELQQQSKQKEGTFKMNQFGRVIQQRDNAKIVVNQKILDEKRVQSCEKRAFNSEKQQREVSGQKKQSDHNSQIQELELQIYQFKLLQEQYKLNELKKKSSVLRSDRFSEYSKDLMSPNDNVSRKQNQIKNIRQKSISKFQDEQMPYSKTQQKFRQNSKKDIQKTFQIKKKDSRQHPLILQNSKRFTFNTSSSSIGHNIHNNGQIIVSTAETNQKFKKELNSDQDNKKSNKVFKRNYSCDAKTFQQNSKQKTTIIDNYFWELDQISDDQFNQKCQKNDDSNLSQFQYVQNALNDIFLFKQDQTTYENLRQVNMISQKKIDKIQVKQFSDFDEIEKNSIQENKFEQNNLTPLKKDILNLDTIITDLSIPIDNEHNELIIQDSEKKKLFEEVYQKNRSVIFQQIKQIETELNLFNNFKANQDQKTLNQLNIIYQQSKESDFTIQTEENNIKETQIFPITYRSTNVQESNLTINPQFSYYNIDTDVSQLQDHSNLRVQAQIYLKCLYLESMKIINDNVIQYVDNVIQYVDKYQHFQNQNCQIYQEQMEQQHQNIQIDQTQMDQNYQLINDNQQGNDQIIDLNNKQLQIINQQQQQQQQQQFIYDNNNKQYQQQQQQQQQSIIYDINNKQQQQQLVMNDNISNQIEQQQKINDNQEQLMNNKEKMQSQQYTLIDQNNNNLQQKIINIQQCQQIIDYNNNQQQQIIDRRQQQIIDHNTQQQQQDCTNYQGPIQQQNLLQQQYQKQQQDINNQQNNQTKDQYKKDMKQNFIFNNRALLNQVKLNLQQLYDRVNSLQKISIDSSNKSNKYFNKSHFNVIPFQCNNFEIDSPIVRNKLSFEQQQFVDEQIQKDKVWDDFMCSSCSENSFKKDYFENDQEQTKKKFNREQMENQLEEIKKKKSQIWRKFIVSILSQSKIQALDSQQTLDIQQTSDVQQTIDIQQTLDIQTDNKQQSHENEIIGKLIDEDQSSFMQESKQSFEIKDQANSQAFLQSQDLNQNERKIKYKKQQTYKDISQVELEYSFQNDQVKSGLYYKKDESKLNHFEQQKKSNKQIQFKEVSHQNDILIQQLQDNNSSINKNNIELESQNLEQKQNRKPFKDIDQVDLQDQDQNQDYFNQSNEQSLNSSIQDDYSIKSINSNLQNCSVQDNYSIKSINTDLQESNVLKQKSQETIIKNSKIIQEKQQNDNIGHQIMDKIKFINLNDEISQNDIDLKSISQSSQIIQQQDEKSSQNFMLESENSKQDQLMNNDRYKQNDFVRKKQKLPTLMEQLNEDLSNSQSDSSLDSQSQNIFEIKQFSLNMQTDSNNQQQKFDFNFDKSKMQKIQWKHQKLIEQQQSNEIKQVNSSSKKFLQMICTQNSSVKKNRLLQLLSSPNINQEDNNLISQKQLVSPNFKRMNSLGQDQINLTLQSFKFDQFQCCDQKSVKHLNQMIQNQFMKQIGNFDFSNDENLFTLHKDVRLLQKFSQSINSYKINIQEQDDCMNLVLDKTIEMLYRLKNLKIIQIDKQNSIISFKQSNSVSLNQELELASLIPSQMFKQKLINQQKFKCEIHGLENIEFVSKFLLDQHFNEFQQDLKKWESNIEKNYNYQKLILKKASEGEYYWISHLDKNKYSQDEVFESMDYIQYTQYFVNENILKVTQDTFKTRISEQQRFTFNKGHILQNQMNLIKADIVQHALDECNLNDQKNYQKSRIINEAKQIQTRKSSYKKMVSLFQASSDINKLVYSNIEQNISDSKTEKSLSFQKNDSENNSNIQKQNDFQDTQIDKPINDSLKESILLRQQYPLSETLQLIKPYNIDTQDNVTNVAQNNVTQNNVPSSQIKARKKERSLSFLKNDSENNSSNVTQNNVPSSQIKARMRRKSTFQIKISEHKKDLLQKIKAIEQLENDNIHNNIDIDFNKIEQQNQNISFDKSVKSKKGRSKSQFQKEIDQKKSKQNRLTQSQTQIDNQLIKKLVNPDSNEDKVESLQKSQFSNIDDSKRSKDSILKDGFNMRHKNSVLNLQNFSKMNPINKLFWAVKNQDQNMINLFLSEDSPTIEQVKLNINSFYEDQNLIMLGCINDDVDLLQKLLQLGANPSIPNKEGLTPIQIASLHQNWKAFDFISKHQNNQKKKFKSFY